MPAEFHLLVQQVLEAAVRLAPADRGLFIERACAGNQRLRDEVCSLLPHYEQVRDFEPRRPEGATWRMPGTTTFSRAGDEAAADAEQEPEPPFMVGRYTVLSIIGRGGMGVVYRALDATRPGFFAAVKLLAAGLATPQDRSRFRMEEEILHRLCHPGIARFLDCGEWHTRQRVRPYFVMEYIEGQSLLKYAAARGLDVRQRLGLLVQVCAAVEFAHRRGIVHRDLKPDNILVEPSGQPKVLDFGLAQFVAAQPTARGAEVPQFAGTPRYASPEQLTGRVAELTPRSDVYTLGLVAHELLTGTLPAPTTGDAPVNLAAVQAEPGIDATESSFTARLAEVLRVALRRDAEARYATAGSFGAQLEQLLAEGTPVSPWAAFKSRLARLFARPAPPEDAASRPLAAVLRKRVALAMKSAEEPASTPERADDDPPPGPSAAQDKGDERT
ncbi:MAG TPA: protein kinase [Phycisphaerae bacterium]|nr:protein kinase [Phycisphaerae bacterium]